MARAPVPDRRERLEGIAIRLDSRVENVYVRADRSHFQQVLMNLILNAGEATQSKPGCVWVTAECPTQKPTDTLPLHISVRDEGVGIPTHQRAKIFDPFFSSKERGHGLGLASVRTIVGELGGKIDVHSREGEGTEIRVKLPIAVAPEPLASKKALVESSPGRLALVVDDEERVREVIAGLMTRLGYRVIEACDGDQALSRFRRQSLDIELVILDLRMPGMDGWDCLSSMRHIRPELPAIICSGYNPANCAMPSSDRKVTHLSKPFRINDLQEALARLSLASPS